MTFSSVFVHKAEASLLKPDYSEVYRYLGYSFKDRTQLEDEVRPIVNQTMEQFSKLILPQSVWICYPLKIEGDSLFFDAYEVKSHALAQYLKGCTVIYLFAATIGPKVDKEIQKMQRLNPVKALVMNACGAMYIEEYCDLLCAQFKNQACDAGFETKNRFSPGFADVSLETQKLFFSVLECSKKIGLTLMDTLIMAPEKSVTAFVGAKKLV